MKWKKRDYVNDSPMGPKQPKSTVHGFTSRVKYLIGADVEVIKRSELHKFVVLPKRWIVERSFGWLEDYRLLWENCERKLHNTLQVIKMAFISLLIRRY